MKINFLISLSCIFLSSSSFLLATSPKFSVNRIENRGAEKLVETDLEGKKLTDFPKLADPGTIKSLNLENNEISVIPDYVTTYVNLEDLDISENKIHTLPNDLTALQKLKKLDLDNNQLTDLPISIGRLPLLEEIELSNNRLRSLPGDVSSWKNLKVLKLQGNLIEYLSQTIGDLKSLKVLNLANNKIRTLPKRILELDLDELDLTGNTDLLERGKANYVGKAELKQKFGDRVKLP